MDQSISKQRSTSFHLSCGDSLKPANSRGNSIYRLPLNQTDLENYTNASYSKYLPYVSCNETPLSSDMPSRNCIMDTEEFKVNKSKENIHFNPLLNSKGNNIFYGKRQHILLPRQSLESSVATSRSNMIPEQYQTNFEPNLVKQNLCSTLLSDLLNPGSKDRSVLALNQQLAPENSKLDLSTLPKRKNTLVAPFCNEDNFYEEMDDDTMSVFLLTEETKLVDKNKETSNLQVPVFRKLLNGFKYYFVRYETRQRCRTKNG
mmetsp:Transcript_8619/g.8513  ORF Transcript_8619/g.8513 Transcript_8619/m.8513 type:complete len:260 (+) Transcript_8619:735-1514(+)